MFHVEHCNPTNCSQPPQLDMNRSLFPTALLADFGWIVQRGTIVIWTYSAKYLNRREPFTFPHSNLKWFRIDCSTWNICIWYTAANQLNTTLAVHFFQQGFKVISDGSFHVEHLHLIHCSQPAQHDGAVNFFQQRFKVISNGLFHVEHFHLTHYSQPPQLDVSRSRFPTAI